MSPTKPEPEREIPLLEEALGRVGHELDALPEKSIRQPNLEVARAVSIAFGVASCVTEKLPEVLRCLPGFDTTLPGRLGDYASVLLRYDAIVRMQVPPVTAPPLQLAQQLRRRLLMNVELLVLYELMRPAVTTKLSMGTNIEGVSKDLRLLVGALRAAHHKIEGRCPVTAAELQQALLISSQLKRPVASAELVKYQAAVQQRARAFTLMMSAYDEVRRTVCYLFPGKRGDTMAPSLYAENLKRKAAKAARDQRTQPAAAANDESRGDSSPSGENDEPIEDRAPDGRC